MKKVIPVLMLAAVLATGCSTGRPSPRKPNPKPTSLHKSVFINDIRLEVATIKSEFPSSEIIPIRISVTNTGAKAVKLTFPTAQKQDFAVTDKDGAEVWRWSEGQMFAQAITETNVEPGATYNYFGKIEADKLEPGRYKIFGWLLAQELFEEKITIDITVK